MLLFLESTAASSEKPSLLLSVEMNLLTLLLLEFHGVKAPLRTASVPGWLPAHPPTLLTDKLRHPELRSLCPRQKISSLRRARPLPWVFPFIHTASDSGLYVAISQSPQAKQGIRQAGWRTPPAACLHPTGTVPTPPKVGGDATISQPAIQLSASKPQIPVYFLGRRLTSPFATGHCHLALPSQEEKVNPK